ncbi:MAG: hypothetical protein PHW95_02950 [Patescibacteria group bacterium]|nr:hypothetical protein [Patescibacteria group bacterium]
MAINKKSKTDKLSGNLLNLALAKYYKIGTAAIIVSLVLSSFFLVLKPKYEEVGVGGQYNLDTLKSELAKRQKYLSDIEALTNNYRNIGQGEVARLHEVLPPAKDVAGLFVQFQSLAEKNNLLLAGVNINEVPEVIKIGSGKSINKLSITVNLVGNNNGSYSEIKNFLASLEDNIRLFDVSAVYFSPGSPNYSVSMFTYYTKGS